MGGKGSGFDDAARRRHKAGGDELEAGINQTEETREHLEQLRRQSGDRLFEVERVYPSGRKAELGTIQRSNSESIGRLFGAGEYRVYEIDRGTGMRTKRPPVTKILSPAKWALIEKFSRDPADVEMEMEAARRGPEIQSMGGARLAGLTPEQIFERAEASAMEKMKKENERVELLHKIELMNQQLADLKNGGGANNTASRFQEMRDMVALMNELRPPQMTPLGGGLGGSLKEAVETIKILQTDLAGLGLAGGAAKANPALETLAKSLTEIAAEGAKGWMASTRAQGRMLPPGAGGQGVPQAFGAQQAPAAGGGTATQAAADVQASEDQVQQVMQELSTRLAADQADQLATPPRSHISETVAWIRQRMNNPAAGPAWANMRTLVQNYPEAGVMQWIVGNFAQLGDNARKQAWLQSVIEMVKRP